MRPAAAQPALLQHPEELRGQEQAQQELVGEQGPEVQAQQEVAGEPDPQAAVPARELSPEAAVVDRRPLPEAAARGQKDARNEGTQARRTLSTQIRVKYPRAGDRILFKEGEEWRDVTVIGRGCKASSKTNPNYFNVKSYADGAVGVDLGTAEWRFNVQEAVMDKQKEVVNFMLIPVIEQGNKKCIAAKEEKLAPFDKFGLYEEAEDKGQEALSSRWVLMDKLMADKKVKARLVVRGFKEKVKVQLDLSTGSKETVHMLLTVAETKGWRIKGGDVKSDYLQGKWLDREVYMVPPLERRKPGVTRRLVKAIYGMNNYSRKWYFEVEETLENLGCKKVKLDHCLFIYRLGEELKIIMLILVDNIFYVGMYKFEAEVIKQVAWKFLIGQTEEETFTHIGLAFRTTEEGITLDLVDYIKDWLVTAHLKLADSKRFLNKEEIQLLCLLTGKIIWVATQSRPDMSFTIVELSSKIKTTQLEELKKANKAINRLSATPSKLLFPRMGGKLCIVTYSDAGFWNLPDKISSGAGHTVFLTNEEREAVPLAWSSNKVKRVVGSTPAAEGLSLQEAVSHTIYLCAILVEIMGKKVLEIPF